MVIFQIDDVVMIVDLPELDGNDIRDGILDAPAHYQQAGTTGYTDDGHEES